MEARRSAWWLGCCVVFAVLHGCATLGDWSPLAPTERKSIFQPAKYPAGEWEQTSVLTQDAYFSAADGVRLHGWYVRHEAPVAHALLLHGNGGNVTLMAESLRSLNRRHNLSVLALDYRGYGRSEGRPTEAGVMLDARAARKWLAEKEGIAETDVVLMGYSLGGAVAIDLAAADNCRGLVVSSTFTSLPDVAQHQLPWLPIGSLMSMQMNSLDKIKTYRGPLLLSHGDADQVIPYAQGLALFEAAPGPKRMITIPGGNHNDPQPEQYRQALDEFLGTLPPLGKSIPRTAALDVSVTPLP
jgi:hypothetical protein